QAQRVIAFAKLVNLSADDAFNKEIGDYLDLDLFLRFMAVNTFLANMDSFFGLGHNYLLYLHPDTNKLIFIPWDLDLAFGGFPFMGTPDQQTDLSLLHPHSGQLKLVDRLLAIPDVRARYQKTVKELTATTFAKEVLLRDIDAVEKATKELLVREKKAADDRKEGKDGKLSQDELLAGIKQFFKDTDKDKKGFLDDKQLAEAINRLMPPPPAFGPKPPDGKQPAGPPPGFGPGNFFAPAILKRADAD